MKFESINKKFTEVVAEWMAKGYYINTATMSGSQGETGKVDLTDGKEIIRILLDDFHDWDRESGHRNYEGLQLIVGRVTDKVQPNIPDRFGNTVWNNNLEILSCEKFYQIGRYNRNGQKWYGSKDEATAQQDKNWERYDSRREDERKELDDRAKAIVLPFVKRQPKCKGVKLADITAVRKVTNRSRFNNTVSVRYEVEAKGKTYKLN